MRCVQCAVVVYSVKCAVCSVQCAMCRVRFEMCTFSTARNTGAARLEAGEEVGQLQVEGEAAVLDGQLEQLKPGGGDLFLVIILA